MQMLMKTFSLILYRLENRISNFEFIFINFYVKVSYIYFGNILMRSWIVKINHKSKLKTNFTSGHYFNINV